MELSVKFVGEAQDEYNAVQLQAKSIFLANLLKCQIYGH